MKLSWELTKDSKDTPNRSKMYQIGWAIARMTRSAIPSPDSSGRLYSPIPSQPNKPRPEKPLPNQR